MRKFFLNYRSAIRRFTMYTLRVPLLAIRRFTMYTLRVPLIAIRRFTMYYITTGGECKKNTA